MRISSAVAGALLLALLSCGCHAFPRTSQPSLVPHASARTPIGRALDYLESTQVSVEDEQTGVDWAGNWPIRIDAESALGRLRVVEVCAFLPAYTHHVLSFVRPDTVARLGLLPGDARRARTMRRLAIRLAVERFRGTGDAVRAYGWWPLVDARRPAGTRWGRWMSERGIRGPTHFGNRTPVMSPVLSPPLRLPADMDDSAVALIARLENERLDGGASAPTSIRDVFMPWRDLPGVARDAPEWLPSGSGAYLTWFVEPRAGRSPNEVDPVVNANALWALARYRELDAPGADEAVALILRAVEHGHHLDRLAISRWYPRVAFHAAVARARTNGPVPALDLVMETLADDLARSARLRSDGTFAWGPRRPGDEAFHTGLAVAALVGAGRRGAVVRGGVRRLLQLQDPRTGGWPEATLIDYRTEAGMRLRWRASPTPFVLDALLQAQQALGVVGGEARRP